MYSHYFTCIPTNLPPPSERAWLEGSAFHRLSEVLPHGFLTFWPRIWLTKLASRRVSWLRFRGESTPRFIRHPKWGRQQLKQLHRDRSSLHSLNWRRERLHTHAEMSTTLSRNIDGRQRRAKSGRVHRLPREPHSREAPQPREEDQTRLRLAGSRLLRAGTSTSKLRCSSENTQ